MNKRKRQPTCCLRQLIYDPLQSPMFIQAPGDTDIVTQYRLQKAKSEIISAQNNAKANIEFITHELEKATMENESLSKAIKDLEFLISSSKCKTIHPKKLSDLCKVKSSLRIDLTNVVHLEKQLKRQLDEARIAYRNSKIDDHMVNEDIKKFKNKSWDSQDLEKRQQVQRRLNRESQCKKNAISAREDTITSVANSITAHVLQKLPGEHNSSQKMLLEAKLAREHASKYFEKSLRSVRKMKAVARTEKQIRQRRQAENLAKLKREINGIKDTLAVKSHMRRLHNEEIAVEKEEVKSLLQAQGANPYLAEYLLAMEEKQRQIQRKMLVEEQKRLLDMQREYSVVEASKAKEEAEKKKWSEYWSKKAMEKAIDQRRSKMEMYFDLSGEEEEQVDPIATELHDKVAERIHERMSQNLSRSQSHLNVVEGEDDVVVVVEDVDDEEEEEEEEEEETPKSKKSVPSSIPASKGKSEKTPSKHEIIKEEAPVHFKPHRQFVGKPNRTKNIKASSHRGLDDKKGRVKGMSDNDETPTVEASLRKAIHLEDTQKESLLKMAGIGENATAILMNDRNVFDFGSVPIGQRKYMMVNVANMGLENVRLKMSVLNPYGPFTFCNSLKEIPQDSYFTLKFKYQPSETDEESQETVKIEEAGKPENFIIIKLKGCAVGFHSEE